MGICNHQSHSRSRSRQAQRAAEETHDREEGQNGKKMIVDDNGGRRAFKRRASVEPPMDAEIVPDLNEYQAVLYVSSNHVKLHGVQPRATHVAH